MEHQRPLGRDLARVAAGASRYGIPLREHRMGAPLPLHYPLARWSSNRMRRPAKRMTTAGTAGSSNSTTRWLVGFLKAQCAGEQVADRFTLASLKSIVGEWTAVGLQGVSCKSNSDHVVAGPRQLPQSNLDLPHGSETAISDLPARNWLLASSSPSSDRRNASA